MSKQRSQDSQDRERSKFGWRTEDVTIKEKPIEIERNKKTGAVEAKEGSKTERIVTMGDLIKKKRK